MAPKKSPSIQAPPGSRRRHATKKDAFVLNERAPDPPPGGGPGRDDALDGGPAR